MVLNEELRRYLLASVSLAPVSSLDMLSTLIAREVEQERREHRHAGEARVKDRCKKREIARA